MMTNWMTSLIGLAILVAGVLLFYAGKITWDQFVLFLGASGLGFASKDHNVTGGTKEQ